MEGFLKTILIVLLVYFALRFFTRLLMPYFLRYIAKKAGQKMEGVFKGFQEQANKANAPQQASEPVTKKSSNVVGEYVDYEDIE
ncbi:MAG: hypothetical protein ACI828_001884 [Flavobacteriales bacterium]|jgi:hypothetical protein